MIMILIIVMWMFVQKIRAGLLFSGNGHCLLHSDTQVNWEVEDIATSGGEKFAALDGYTSCNLDFGFEA